MLDRLRVFLSPGANGRDSEAGRRNEDSGVGHLTDAETRSESSHELYIDSTCLASVLASTSPTRSLEMGCGSGRLTPSVADQTGDHYAIDLARTLLSAACREHTDVKFHRAGVEALPLADDAVDLAVTRGGLNHVPADSICAATDDISRVIVSDGALVISETTAGTPDPRREYRSIRGWRDIFPSHQLVWRTYTERDDEPFRNPDREHVVMKFR